jgi:hypothetical protein
LIPAGVFYINLRGTFKTVATRAEALTAPSDTRKAGYQHQGLFNLRFLQQLDSRNVGEGDQ